MYKLSIVAITTSLLILWSPHYVSAELIAGSSAGMEHQRQFLSEECSYSTDSGYGSMDTAINKDLCLALKHTVIIRVLSQYRSPLASHTTDLISACTKYKINCYLLPSIAGVESTFGRFIPYNSYNPFGWGKLYFTDFSNSIDAVGEGLRKQYLNQQLSTIDQIGKIYCSGNTWANNVTYFYLKFLSEEKKLLQFYENTVKL